MCCCLQAWQPLPASPLLVTGGKDGRVLVYDVTEYAEPPEDDMPIPKFSAPAAVAPNPDLKDEVTALSWGISNPQLLYAAHASGARLPEWHLGTQQCVLAELLAWQVAFALELVTYVCVCALHLCMCR